MLVWSRQPRPWSPVAIFGSGGRRARAAASLVIDLSDAEPGWLLPLALVVLALLACFAPLHTSGQADGCPLSLQLPWYGAVLDVRTTSQSSLPLGEADLTGRSQCSRPRR